MNKTTRKSSKRSPPASAQSTRSTPAQLDTLDELRHDINNLIFPLRAHLNLVTSSFGRSHSAEHLRSLRAISDTIGFIQSLINYPREADCYSNNMCMPTTDFHLWWRSSFGILECVLPTNVRLACANPSTIPCIAIDSLRFTQAILNLISNARDAMTRHSIQHGRIMIEAKEHKSSRRGECVRVKIRDNAGGMTAQVLKSAFKRSVTTKVDAKGGLGLQIVNQIVREAHGSVAIRSTPGKGTSIDLFLPIATHTHTHTHTHTTTSSHISPLVNQARFRSPIESHQSRTTA